MSASILRISTLAAANVARLAGHLAAAGYGTKTALARDKAELDRAATAYRAFHAEAMEFVGYDPDEPGDVASYMEHVPRCGCPDVLPGQAPDGTMSFERGQHGRWPHYGDGIRVHWQFSRIGTLRTHQFARTVDQAIRDALREWEMICGLRFRVVSSRAEANISMADGRIDGASRTLAWSMLPPRGVSPTTHLTNTQTGTTQLYDWDESWNDSQAGNISLKWVAFHELGHALGWGHSPDKDDVMFAAYIPGRANIPGRTERRVAAEDYPGEPLRPDAPSPPTPPGQPGGPKRGSVRLVNGIFSGDYEVIA